MQHYKFSVLSENDIFITIAMLFMNQFVKLCL